METKSSSILPPARIIPIQDFNIHQSQPAFSQNIFVSNKECIFVIKPFDILYLKAEGSYASIQLSNGKKHLASKTLKSFMPKLSSNHFMRVHNSYIVNINFIEKVLRNNQMHLVLKGGFSIPISRNKQKSLLKLIK
jgi:two-component system LytT family response regulator